MYTKAKWVAASLFLGLCISACKSIPDLSASYYLPKTSVSVHVVRTFACNAAKEIFTTSAVTAAVTHSADLDKRKTIALRNLDGPFSDTDFQLQLYEDGRLKGINSSTTGEAEAVIKPLVAVASAAFGSTESAPEAKGSCSISADPSKPISLTFTREVDFKDIGAITNTGAEMLTSDQAIDPDPDSAPTFAKTREALGYLCVRVEKMKPKPDDQGKSPADIPALENTVDAANNVELQLQQPAPVALTVWSSKEQDCVYKNEKAIWTGQTEVAQIGTPYQLPMPKAVLFGKLQLSLALAESGALTTMQYTKQAAAPSLVIAGQDISTHVAPETAVQKAADLKAEGDIIAQQQRLVRCRADPKNCT